jgi:hypothetical protein
MRNLCDHCQTVLYRSWSESHLTDLDTGFVAHHSTLQSLQDAAARKCPLCCIVWDDLQSNELYHDKLVSVLQDEDRSSAPVTSRLFREDEQYDNPLLKLEVHIEHPDISSYSSFRLVPSEGE